MEIKKIKLTEIKTAPYNPRRISPEEMEKLKRSIKTYGYVDPIIVNKNTMHAVGGNQRLEALRELGYSDVDVVFVDLKDLNDEKALNVALNKISGEWDEPLLTTLLEDLQLEGFDVELTGFDNVELEEMFLKEEKVVEDDFDPDKPLESTVQFGDIWQLGDHRLLCGDACDKEDVNILVGNNRIDMVFTDPPYDFKHDAQLYPIIDIVTENSHIFIMHDDRGIVNYLKNSNFNFDRFFVLDTKIASPRGNDPYLRHILVSHETKGQPMKHKNQYDGLSSIIHIDYRKNIKEERLHAHQKTVKDISKFIKHYSKKEDNVLDLFGDKKRKKKIRKEFPELQHLMIQETL